jgi:uncharacterized 2Fe-2S/4Fe-4S cluster protein (DUF4445 family)
MKKPRKKKRRSFSLPPPRKQKRRHIWLKVLPEDLWLKVGRGKTILEALQKTDVELEGDCGGLGKCGKCKVKVLSSLGPPSKEGKELLEEEEIRQGVRLACRTKLKKDLTIQVGESEEETYYQILKMGRRPIFHLDPLLDKKLVTLNLEGENSGLADFERIKLAMGPNYDDLTAPLHCLRTLPDMLARTQFHGAAVLHGKSLLAWQPWEEGGRRYGLVFDLGTSTLVGKLISLLDGNEVAAISRLNSQSKYGSNVISRLQYVKENSKGLERLNELLIKDLNRITKRLLYVGGLQPEDIFIGVAAGNTTMQHLLLSLDPRGIAQAPFNPVSTDGMIVKAADLGLEVHPEALLYVMPTRSGYIGGDLISAVLASGAAEEENKMILGLDLGTNGEIFLGNRKRLLTCSAAAGPALEGAKISQGMIARSGAIEGVSSGNGDFSCRVISNIKPKGICGSGLVDLAAVLLHAGIIDYEGLVQPGLENAGDVIGARVIEKSGVYDFLVAASEESLDGRPIYLRQKDIRELQLAKGAVAAGIKTLMDEMGIGVDGIDLIYLAGALGNYVHPLSAMRIGLIPRVRPDIVQSLGNAASTGASMVLLSKAYWQKANDLAHSIEHIELSTRLDFNEYFVESLNFPEENLW